MSVRRRAAARLVAALLTCGALAGCSSQDTVLVYVAVPHPDDEYQAWSLIGDRPDEYPVFLLLTKGERTAMCDGRGLQADAGERTPRPQPFAAGDTERCAAQRVDSWHAFLDGMAEIDATLDVPSRVGAFHGEAPADDAQAALDGSASAATEYDLWVGERSARMVFDLGDGDLTPDEVAWAVQTARGIRGEHLPVTAEHSIVAAAFANAGGHGDCTDYPHPDHLAVHTALWETDLGVPGPQLARTCRSDPRVAETSGPVRSVDPSVHQAVWGVDPGPVDPRGNPDAERTGVAQRVYGWLAFTFEPPNPQTYWEVGEHDDTTGFSRTQAFWSRHDG